MKYILITLSLLISMSAFAELSFEKGAGAPDIHPRLLRKLLLQGKTNYEGATIALDKGVIVPSDIQKKWDEIKLTGGNVPQEGTLSDKTILIKSF